MVDIANTETSQEQQIDLKAALQKVVNAASWDAQRQDIKDFLNSYGFNEAASKMPEDCCGDGAVYYAEGVIAQAEANCPDLG